MPRSSKQITSDAHAASGVVSDAPKPLRFEEIRQRLRAVGVELSIKQARRTLEVAETLRVVNRVNRSRWGRVGVGHPPPTARRSRAETVIEVAARLLDLPPSAELHSAVRQVLRLATEQEVRKVLPQDGPRKAPPLAAPAPGTPSATPAVKMNGARHAADQIEVCLDAHS